MTIDIESTLKRKLIFHYRLLSGGMYRDSIDYCDIITTVDYHCNTFVIHVLMSETHMPA